MGYVITFVVGAVAGYFGIPYVIKGARKVWQYLGDWE